MSQGKVGGGGSDSEALTKSSEEVAKLKETLSKCETKIHEMSDETSTVQAELESCKKQQELQDQCCKDAADSAAQIFRCCRRGTIQFFFYSIPFFVLIKVIIKINI